MARGLKLGAGWVKTARGKNLNFAALKEKAKTPVKNKLNIDMKNKIQKMKKPKEVNNIDGFMPDTSVVAMPPVYNMVNNKVILPIEEIEDEETITQVDITGLIIEKPKFLKEKPESAIGAANAVLEEITKDLDRLKRNKEKESKHGSKS